MMLVLMIGTTFHACIDKTYSLDKEIDLTIGLGSDKLTMKMGRTEKIFLRDMLKVDDSDIIDTLTTGESLYYLVRDGSAQQLVTVGPIAPFTIADVSVSPDTPLLLAPAADRHIPKGNLTPDLVEADELITATIDDISPDVVRLFRANLQPKQLRLSLLVEQPEYAKVVISQIKNLVITFPDFMHSPAFVDGKLTLPTITGNTDKVITLPGITLDYMQFGRADAFGELIRNHRLTEQQKVRMNGEFTLQATEAFSLRQGDHVNVKLLVQPGTFSIATIQGTVDPDISPTVNPIKIAGDVPDFMRDPDVVLEVNNPTIKISIGGDDRPIPLLFRSEVYAETDGEAGMRVPLPAADYTAIPTGGSQTYYYYQGNAPFDPAGIDVPDEHLFPMYDFNTVIRKLPDQVNMYLKEGNIQSDKSRLHTIRPGSSFDVHLDYRILIPFRFDRGLRIVYNDSIDDLHKDLHKYQADGITVTAQAVNTIPLELKLLLTPRDADGNLLTDEIEEATATIAAATGPLGTEQETPLTLTMKLHNRAALSRLDRFDIRIACESVASSELYSSLYLFLREVRLQLNGQVIADFN